MAGPGPGATVGLAAALISWFEAGWSVYRERIRDPDFFPPLGQ